MDPRADLPTLTLHGLEQSIVALPYQLGYHPRHSLVLLCLAASRRSESRSAPRGEQVSLTARVDLPQVGDQAAFVAALDPALRRPETTSVIAMVFADPTRPRVDSSGLLGEVATRARHWGVAVRALAVVAGRCWREVPPCVGVAGPWQRLPHPRDVPAVADYVAAGRAPAPDRRALEELLCPRDPALAARVAAVLRDEEAYGSPGAVGAVTPAHAAVVATVFGQLLGGAGLLSVPTPQAEDLARCASTLHDVSLRDSVLSRITGVEPKPHQVTAPWRRAVHRHLKPDRALDRAAAVRLTSAAAYAPTVWAAPWLTVAGLVAWHAGDGAVANIAVEAALRSDPDYSLAGLMELIVSNAVPPPSRRTTDRGARCV